MTMAISTFLPSHILGSLAHVAIAEAALRFSSIPGKARPRVDFGIYHS